ncbi:MAG: hypothetical protein LBT80_00985 [Lactobacillaceae bacterium]|jgi:hypothetical protein|nr:hypothetical protein [Lactobacillaceae bacterium]
MKILETFGFGLIDGIKSPIWVIREIANIYRDPESVHQNSKLDAKPEALVISNDFLAIGNDMRKIMGRYVGK